MTPRLAVLLIISSDSVCCRSCNVFPTVNVNGTLRHLLLTPVQLVEYQQQLEHVLTRYLQRLQWLLLGNVGTSEEFHATVYSACH